MNYNDNPAIKYPLSDEELQLYDNVWDFLEIFKMNYIFASDFRKHIIDKVREGYDPEEFLKMENLLDKLFWNLRYVLGTLMINPDIDSNNKLKESMVSQLPTSLTLCEKIPYSNSKLPDLLNDNFIIRDERYSHYRSFINKLIIVDSKKKVVWMKNMEGSSDIFAKNNFNLYTITILFNRQQYEKFMQDPITSIKNKVKLAEYYFQHDYPFPNLNFCDYSINNEDVKLDRINKMYFNKTGCKEEYWYKIIY